jgi:hypothetical protein
MRPPASLASFASLCFGFALALAALLPSGAQAAETRFDAYYFFQSDEAMQEKQVDAQGLGRFSRAVQSAVWKSLRKVKLAPSSGYLVLAVRADGKVAAWLDMEPALHEYYEAQILDAVKTVRPFPVAQGSVVFAIKMAIDTPVFTAKQRPAPKDWAEALQRLGDEDIEALVNAAWPE